MQQQPSDDLGRRSRFAFDPDPDPPSRHSRAASQPPRQSDSLNSPIDFAQRRLEGSAASPRTSSHSAGGWPPIARPTFPVSRSVSFSEQPTSNSFMAHLSRESRLFPSTFEDDEDSVDDFDGFATPRNPDESSRGRPQSIGAASRRPMASSPLQSSYNFNTGYGAPGQSARYNPTLAPGRIDTNVGSPSSRAYNHLGYRPGRDDLSNMSPFVRDVSQILNQDGLAHRDPWGASTLITHEDGGGSGTTSRRHSVSVVQPRRAGLAVGFSASGGEGSPQSAVSEVHDGVGSFRSGGFGGGRGLMFSDEELAGSLNMLNLNLDQEPRRAPRVSGPSQPSSLPTYAPHRAVGSPIELVGSRLNNLPIPSSGDFPSSYGSSHNITGSLTSSRLDAYSDHDRSSSPAADRSQLDNGFANGYAHGVSRNGNGNGNSTLGQTQYNDGFSQPSAFQQSILRGDALKQQQYSYTEQPQFDASRIGAGRTNSQLSPTSRGPPLPPLSFQGMSRNAAFINNSMTSPLSPNASNYPGAPPPLPSPTATYNLNPNVPNYYPPQNPVQRQRQPSLSQVAPVPETSATVPNGYNDQGRGVPLYAVPASAPLYIVEFKAGRTDIFYCADPTLHDIHNGDLVIVEADRGRDLGRVTNDSITPADIEAYQRQQAENAALQQLTQGTGDDVNGGSNTKPATKELMPKRIYSKAQPQDTQSLPSKLQDEAKALQLCQSKVRQKKLPMEVVDAEYQWDRRKLTFYFVADRRIDFRELVRELFRLYKTRIWMACLQGPVTE